MNEQDMLVVIRTIVRSLPSKDRDSIVTCAEQLRAIVNTTGPLGALALVLVGAELNATKSVVVPNPFRSNQAGRQLAN